MLLVRARVSLTVRYPVSIAHLFLYSAGMPASMSAALSRDMLVANTRYTASRLPSVVLNLLTMTMVYSYIFPLDSFLALSLCFETAPSFPS